MEGSVGFIDKRKLRLTRSADQLQVFKLKKRKKCKHRDIICRIPLPVPPRITVWSILNEEDAIKIKNCPMPVKIDIINDICEKFYEKKRERRIMRALYHEVLRFCLKRNYIPMKIATLFGMYHATHQFYTSSLWHDYEETYKFFKETLFIHSINDPPESVQIFSMVDIKAILQRFTTLYLPVLPLLRQTILPNVRLWMYWHECKPEIPNQGKDVDMTGMAVEPNLFTGRSDWDPWDIIQKDEVLDDRQQEKYIYKASKLDMSSYGDHEYLHLFDEEENTEGSEEETENKSLTKNEEVGEEDYEYKSDNQIEYQDIAQSLFQD